MYACIAYALAARVMIYMVGFLGNIVVPKSVDSGGAGAAGTAIAADCVLLVSFALSHSLLARQPIKDLFTAQLPRPVERSTYVFVSALMLTLVIWLWRPVPNVIWDVRWFAGRAALVVLSSSGWVLALASSHTLGHFDLYGIQPAWRYVRRREDSRVGLKTDKLYGLVRHPMYAGFALGIWSSPRMTGGHLLFATAMTIYLIVGMRFEERDLERRFGQPYLDYRRRVGLIPLFRAVHRILRLPPRAIRPPAHSIDRSRPSA